MAYKHMKKFDNIIGQEIAKKLLNSAIEKEKLAHGYLFIGPANVGKFKMALELAKIVQCKDIIFGGEEEKKEKCQKIEKGFDPDVMVIDPFSGGQAAEGEGEKKTISIKEIRELEHHLSLFPFQSKHKIAIINGADKFTEEAANAFLKTLEEPKGETLIILIAETKNLLPQTLISRTQIVRFYPARKEAVEKYLISQGADGSEAGKIALISGGKIGLAAELFRNKEKLLEYEEDIKSFEKFLSGSVNENFLDIDGLLENEERINELLERWLEYSRGLLLAEYGEDGGALELPEKNKGKKISAAKLAKFVNHLNSLLNLIKTSNVNKKLALENLALDI